jgi:hypothetical protein
MEKSRDYNLIMERATAHDFSDSRLAEYYGRCVLVVLHETENGPEDIGFTGDLREVVDFATAGLFTDELLSIFSQMDADAEFSRIANSPDDLSETLAIISEYFRTHILRFVNGREGFDER